MPWLSAGLRLIRWENALIAAAGVLVGAWWVGGDPLLRTTVLAAAAAIALAAVANAYNDLTDVEIDRIAHPDRPLPSGAMSARAAGLIVRVAAVLAVALSTSAVSELGLVSIAVIAMMMLYSRVLKRLGLVGNLTVAALASLPFLYGGWSVGRPMASLTLVALAMPLHLAREIAKDIEDAEGDSLVRRTLPVAAGKSVTNTVLLAALGAFLVALTLFARSRPLFALAVLPAVLLATIATHRAIAGKGKAPLLFKSAMLCAMASLLVVREH